MTTPEERLRHDIETGVMRHLYDRLRYNYDPAAVKLIADQLKSISEQVQLELRVRWTIIERPRKQRTLRQES